MSKYKIGLGAISGDPYLLLEVVNIRKSWYKVIRLCQTYDYSLRIGTIGHGTSINPASVTSFTPFKIPLEAVNINTISYIKEALLETIDE